MSKFEKHITFVLMLLLSSALIKAQIPLNDSAWIRQDANHGTDEFNATPATSKWYKCFPWNCGTYSKHLGAELNYPENVRWETGDTTVTFIADTILQDTGWVHVVPSDFNLIPDSGVHYAYTGGILWRKQFNFGSGPVDIYKNGYIEILAKYPGGEYPVWPAFWLYGEGPDCYDGTPTMFDYRVEIDIAENWPSVTVAEDSIGTNVHLSSWYACDDNQICRK